VDENDDRVPVAVEADALPVAATVHDRGVARERAERAGSPVGSPA
jgi:hypothetical protein